MAKANPMQYIRKPEPAVLELEFNLPAGTRYLDINQVLSLVNRKFLRQGMQVPVASIEVQFEPTPPVPPETRSFATGTVTISKLPTTWIMANAWNKSFLAWQKMNDKALEETESLRPRFLDFKIYADAQHHALGFGLNIMPTSIPSTGEWESSKIFHPVGVGSVEGATHEAELIATGANWPGPGASLLNAASLIEGYAASRALPDVVDPNTPDDARDTDNFTPENWMAAIFNDGTEQTSDIIDELTSENNVAPYPFENGPINGFPGSYWTDTKYPNGANQIAGLQFHDKLLITTTTIGGSDTAIGGVFPCGLIRFDTTITGGTATMILRLVPGHERGYLQEPMQEMNRQ